MTSNAPGQSCCGHSAGPTEPIELATVAPEQAATDMAECPVMEGTPVNKAHAESRGLFRDFEGARYYLCCAGCGPKFDADPRKYATASA
jgi:YHS domain-containing protein